MSEREVGLFQITVNGKQQVIPSRQSISGLLEQLGLSADRVAVELNKSIVRKRDWENTLVPEYAQIEVVEFVGGG